MICLLYTSKKDAEELAAKLEGVSLKIATKVSSTGTIFGSVGNIQICLLYTSPVANITIVKAVVTSWQVITAFFINVD